MQEKNKHMVCVFCDNKINDGDNFCSGCGKKAPGVYDGIAKELITVLLKKDITYCEATEALDACKVKLRTIRRGDAGRDVKLLDSIEIDHTYL